MFTVHDLYLGFNMLREQQLLILAHRTVHLPDTIPDLFADYLSRNESVHTYNTRNKHAMHLFRANTGYGLRYLIKLQNCGINCLWNCKRT